jgi:hypothetical protein
MHRRLMAQRRPKAPIRMHRLPKTVLNQIRLKSPSLMTARSLPSMAAAPDRMFQTDQRDCGACAHSVHAPDHARGDRNFANVIM